MSRFVWCITLPTKLSYWYTRRVSGLCFWLLKSANGFYQKMQTTCWVCYSSSSVLFIPQTALTEAAFSWREAVLPGLTVCWYQLHSKSLSVPDISGGSAVPPFWGNVVCLSLNCFCWSFLFFSQSSFAKFFPYLLINPFPHQASVILLKYNLIIFFPWSPSVCIPFEISVFCC